MTAEDQKKIDSEVKRLKNVILKWHKKVVIPAIISETEDTP